VTTVFGNSDWPAVGRDGGGAQPPEARPPAPAGHEQVVFCHDAPTGLRAIIAIYSTALGPALGGTRFYPYPNEDAALADVLNLARAMAYKNAMAGLDHGGGKAVIIGDPARLKSEALLRAYGRFVQSLNGRYITACDVGTYSEDMDIVARECRHVTGRTVPNGGAGDSSVLTAFGVFQGMRAAAEHAWGTSSLEGRRVGVEGVGKVGQRVVDHLIEAGAQVVVCDVNPGAVQRVRTRHPSVEATAGRDSLLASATDIFSPCALGGAISDHTLALLTARSSAAAPTTSWPTRASRSSSPTAALSTRPTTWSIPAASSRSPTSWLASASSVLRPGQGRSSIPRRRSSRSPTRRGCRPSSPPTGWRNGGCPRWAGSGASGWEYERAEAVKGDGRRAGAPQASGRHSIRPEWPEARAAQSRYLWMCTEERARCAPAVERRRVVYLCEKAPPASPIPSRAEGNDRCGDQEPDRAPVRSRGSSQWGAAEPRPSR